MAGKREAFLAERDAAIAADIDAVHLGNLLAAEGITTVAVDEDGSLVQHRPDGSVAPKS